MRNPLSVLSALICLAGHAQYGTFDAAAVKAARSTTLFVVLDPGDSPYNRAITNAVKSEWKFNSGVEYITVADLATQPIDPAKTYLLKTLRTDPIKFEGIFLALVRGWKPKKGEALRQTDNSFTSIPMEQELASLLIEPRAINEQGMSAMLHVYVKHLQDYLKQVETGKVMDKTTADRLYAGRTRLIREAEFILVREHLDKSLPDGDAIKTEYASPFRIGGLADAAGAAEAQDRDAMVSDVVITVGDHKNKHCFKRVFNAGTGELMYLRDDAAIFGKKEGFIAEDFKAIARAR
ncbi:MAG: hypothetical protein IPM46_13585 [Flavobacteriales bacterium]|nr:hypothetical protein [Flavobacteriales bacterium]